ncbi:hypothetical protein [Rhodobacter sp. TJ_12]|uniref:hypothetical protein n=1 Tax=Rhodobacter sp. TJ_12 TaxID=2029399 RepID=UPI001CBD0BAC|nr:hypothetical protein [Rhodobacter sp. TJ_12]
MTPVSPFPDTAPQMAPELAAFEPFGLTDLISALCKDILPAPMAGAGLEALLDRVEGQR